MAMNAFDEEILGKADDCEVIPPAALPRVPRLFWSAHPEFEKLVRQEQVKVKDVLECLGPPPFPKTGFPFIGFLATVYDHVVTNTPVGEDNAG